MGANANKEEDWVAPDFSLETNEDVSYIKISPNREVMAIGYGAKHIRVYNIASK